MKLHTTFNFAQKRVIKLNGEIYIIKNDINDKVYIGQTIQGSNKRFEQHLKLLKSNSSQLIHKAIKKYGKEHFFFETLESNIPIYKLDEREEYWIRKHNSVSHGYNLCYGGKQSRREPNPIYTKYGQEIIGKYQNGNISIRCLAKEYGLSHKSVSAFLKKNNILVKSRNKIYDNLTEDEKMRIAIMYTNGYITKEIAKIFNRAEATVRRYKKYKCCV